MDIVALLLEQGADRNIIGKVNIHDLMLRYMIRRVGESKMAMPTYIDMTQSINFIFIVWFRMESRLLS